MPDIERQVHIEAAPVAVAARLATSPWRAAYAIEPEAAGTRVEIRATVEPEALARVVEAATLEEVCRLRSALDPGVDGDDRPAASRNGPLPIETSKRRRNTMTVIERTVTIDAPAEQVWPALADFGGISAWNPNVKASRLTSTRDEGAGMTRECRLTPMGVVQEEVTEWVEGRMMTIEITDFKNVPAMRSAVAVLELSPRGDRSRVDMRMDYEVGLGAVGAGMNSVMMKRQFGKAVTTLLAGLKHHIETGEQVGGTSDVPKATVATVAGR